MAYIRMSKRSREATHGFMLYTDVDLKIDNPHTPAAALRKLRRAAAGPTRPAPPPTPSLAPARDAARPAPLRERVRDAARRPTPGP